ncbi:hypothetical protein FKM82_022928 [Ascaphus truei]
MIHIRYPDTSRDVVGVVLQIFHSWPLNTSPKAYGEEIGKARLIGVKCTGYTPYALFTRSVSTRSGNSNTSWLSERMGSVGMYFAITVIIMYYHLTTNVCMDFYLHILYPLHCICYDTTL